MAGITQATVAAMHRHERQGAAVESAALRRVAACVRIQSSWRGCIMRWRFKLASFRRQQARRATRPPPPAEAPARKCSARQKGDFLTTLCSFSFVVFLFFCPQARMLSGNFCVVCLGEVVVKSDVLIVYCDIGDHALTDGDGPSRAKSASRPLRRSLLMPQVNPGSRYRCGNIT